jgi:hypothetical protein
MVVVMMKCSKCNSDIPGTVLRCPNCRTPSNTGMLSTTTRTTLLDRVVSNHLARSISSSLLERADNLNSLDDEIERRTVNSLTTRDLQNVITNLNKNSTPQLSELENMLSLNPENITLEGIKLSGLLDGKGNDMAILKNGIVFLKYRKYTEAIEWWTLNRQRLDPKKQKLHFVLLIMEAFTYTLNGDELRAEQVRRKIFNHPLYEKYKEKKAPGKIF